MFFFFFFQAEDGIRDKLVTGVQTCALPISRAGGDVLRDPLKIVRLETTLAWCEIGLRVDHQLRKIGLVERFDARGERGVAQNKNRRAVFARDARRFNRDVETIFDARRCEYNTRAVAVTAEDGLMQIALLNI